MRVRESASKAALLLAETSELTSVSKRIGGYCGNFSSWCNNQGIFFRFAKLSSSSETGTGT